MNLTGHIAEFQHFLCKSSLFNFTFIFACRQKKTKTKKQTKWISYEFRLILFKLVCKIVKAHCILIYQFKSILKCVTCLWLFSVLGSVTLQQVTSLQTVWGHRRHNPHSSIYTFRWRNKVTPDSTFSTLRHKLTLVFYSYIIIYILQK